MHYWINFQKLVNRCRAVDVTLSRVQASCYGMQLVSETCFCVDTEIGVYMSEYENNVVPEGMWWCRGIFLAIRYLRTTCLWMVNKMEIFIPQAAVPWRLSLPGCGCVTGYFLTFSRVLVTSSGSVTPKIVVMHERSRVLWWEWWKDTVRVEPVGGDSDKRWLR